MAAPKASVELIGNPKGTTNTSAPTSRSITLDPLSAIVARLAGVSKADLRSLKVQEFREAATYLGNLYRAFEEKELGEWALPNRLSMTGDAIMSPQLNRATAKIFGSNVPFGERFRRYENYYDLVIPEIKRGATVWAKKTLEVQIGTLSALEVEITNPAFALWMSEAAREISSESAGCREAEKARVLSDLRQGYSGASPAPEEDSHLPDLGFAKNIRACFVKATKSFIQFNSRHNAHLAYDYVPPNDRNISLLTILLIHPRFTELLEAYRDGPFVGTRLSQQVFREALDATRKFSADSTESPNSIWRYGVFVEGGIKEIGLSDIDGLAEFAINIGKHLDKNAAADLLNYIGIALLIVGLLSGVGTLLAVLDIAVGGAFTYLSYVRNRQQEFGVKSSIFLLDEKKFASSYGYGDTALGAAFLLLGVASLLRPLARVIGPSQALKRVTADAQAANLQPTSQASDVRALSHAQEVPTSTTAEQGINDSIKAAMPKEQAMQRGLKPPGGETTQKPSLSNVRKNSLSARGVENLKSLAHQLKTVEEQIEGLRNHPNAPVLQRDLDYIRTWASRGRETEARGLLNGLTKRVEAANLSLERGAFDRVHEVTEDLSGPDGESGGLEQIRDRPPGVTKSDSKLWARVRNGEEVNLTRFQNPPGEKLRIDPNFRPFGEGGPTNRELAKDGRACYLRNGDRVELHHRDQDPFGPLDEHSESYHQFIGEDPEFHPEISDPGYESWRRFLAIFAGKRRTLGEIYRTLREKYWKARFE